MLQLKSKQRIRRKNYRRTPPKQQYHVKAVFPWMFLSLLQKIAAQTGNLVEMKQCVDNGVDIEPKDNAVSTALHFASEGGHLFNRKMSRRQGSKRQRWTESIALRH